MTGMDCAQCATKLENGIARLDDVHQVRVDFMTERMHIDGNASLELLNQRAQSLGGYQIHDHAEKQHTPLSGGVMGFVRYLLAEPAAQFAMVGGGVTLLILLYQLMGMPKAFANYGYMLGVAIAAYPIARSGINYLIVNKTFNLNLLMTIAAVGAVVIGETLEAAVVVFLFAVGEALEGFTSDRARQSIRTLADIAPEIAHRRTGDLTETVPISELTVGDTFLIKPGERVPMDGKVMDGHSAVNQAPITGESIPVNKQPGDAVYAGTINGDGALTVRVTHTATENTLSRIIKLVEEAQNVRAPAQRRIDQFSAYYTPAMVVLAALVAVVPPLLFGAPFFEPATSGHGWLYRALALLVISCPCALVISTPVTVVSAITTAARRGVLIKGGLHLETLGKVRAIAFDKTGTLTQGEPRVTHFRTIDCNGDDECELCIEMIAYAAAVEQQSTHPLARAVVGAAPNANQTATAVTNLSGRGVQGTVAGHTVTVGSHRLFDEQFPHDDALCDVVAQHEQQGHTTMLVAQDEQVLGMIAVADTPRETSATVIDELNTLGLSTIMLTGDNETVAWAIAGRVGVWDVRANLLPQDKSHAVEQLRARFGKVAMVGDGVNDTPALAAADVGIAMGSAGSAQAIETADIALMADDLRQLPFTVRLSRMATRLIGQNIVLSIGVKGIIAAMAIGGLTSLWLAIFADVGMLVLVTLNGMRPLRFGQR